MLISNIIQREIAQMMAEGISLSEIVASLESIQWDEWIEEVRQYHIGLTVICHRCQHNFDRDEGALSGSGYVCNRCSQEESNKPLMIQCQECQSYFPFKDAWSRKSVISLGKLVCSDCLDIVIDRDLKIPCIACNMRFLPKQGTVDICDDCRKDSRIFEEYQRVRNHVARAKKSGVAATLTLRQWLSNLEYFNWKCAYCLSPFYDSTLIRGRFRQKVLGLEHFIPLNLGGGTTQDNCVPSCWQCNSAKRDRHPDTFAKFFPQENIERIKAYFASLELTEAA
jgi:5-methylcytosine-specific restriction endonuclease McrA